MSCGCRWTTIARPIPVDVRSCIEWYSIHVRVVKGYFPPLLSSRAVVVAFVWLQISAVLQVLLAAFLVTLILMHSGREAGFGGMGFTPASQGGTHIVERNLTRVTVVVATLFFLNTILLFRLLK